MGSAVTFYSFIGFVLAFAFSNRDCYVLYAVLLCGVHLEKEDISLDRFYTLKHCIADTVAFLILFPTLTLLRENIGSLMGGVIWLIIS